MRCLEVGALRALLARSSIFVSIQKSLKRFNILHPKMKIQFSILPTVSSCKQSLSHFFKLSEG